LALGVLGGLWADAIMISLLMLLPKFGLFSQHYLAALYEMKTRHESAYHQIHPGGGGTSQRRKDLKMKPFSLFYFPDDEIDTLECLQPAVGWPSSVLIEPDDEIRRFSS